MAPDGSGYTVLHTFVGADGTNPRRRVLQSDDGTLYGTTSRGGFGDAGTIFRIAPSGTGYTVLHDFDDLGDAGFRDPTLSVPGKA